MYGTRSLKALCLFIIFVICINLTSAKVPACAFKKAQTLSANPQGVTIVKINENFEYSQVKWVVDPAATSIIFNITTSSSSDSFLLDNTIAQVSTDKNTVTIDIAGGFVRTFKNSNSEISAASTSKAHLSILPTLLAAFFVFGCSTNASSKNSIFSIKTLTFMGLIVLAFMACNSSALSADADPDCSSMTITITVPPTIKQVCENGVCRCNLGWNGMTCSQVAPNSDDDSDDDGDDENPETSISESTSENPVTSSNSEQPQSTSQVPVTSTSEQPVTTSEVPVTSTTEEPVTSSTTEELPSTSEEVTTTTEVVNPETTIDFWPF